MIDVLKKLSHQGATNQRYLLKPIFRNIIYVWNDSMQVKIQRTIYLVMYIHVFNKVRKHISFEILVRKLLYSTALIASVIAWYC